MKLLLFLLFPLIELYSLVTLGEVVGGLNVILLVVASFLLGLWVLRTQTQVGLQNMRSELGSGRVPENFMWDNLFIYLAGVLLMIPGVISDIVGLMLLVPFIRKICCVRLTKYLQSKAAQGSYRSSGNFFVFTSTQHYSNGQKHGETKEDGVFECKAEDLGAKDSDIVFDCTTTDEQDKKILDDKKPE